jgi:hypothetical protein
VPGPELTPVDPAGLPLEPGAFRAYLERRGLNFALLTPLDASKVRLRFTGPFGGREVIWDARLLALAARERAEDRPAAGFSQFLEIGEPGSAGIPLTVGLAEEVVDLAVVQKTIIMIRKYKRLHPGRHEYGQRLAKRAPGADRPTSPARQKEDL